MIHGSLHLCFEKPDCSLFAASQRVLVGAASPLDRNPKNAQIRQASRIPRHFNVPSRNSQNEASVSARWLIASVALSAGIAFRLDPRSLRPPTPSMKSIAAARSSGAAIKKGAGHTSTRTKETPRFCVASRSNWPTCSPANCTSRHNFNRDSGTSCRYYSTVRSTWSSMGTS